MFKTLTCLWLMQAGLAFAQPKLITETDTREANVGDPVVLSVRLMFEDGWTFHEPLMDEKLGDAAILEQTWSPAVRDPESALNRQVFQLKLAWYKLGPTTIPAFDIAATSPDGQEQRFQTAELSFEIVPLLKEDDLSPADIKGQVSMQTMPWWPFALAALVLLAILAFALWWFLRPKAKAPTEAPTVPLLPPAEEALKALEALTHGPLLKEGDYKTFHVQINLIIRRYYTRLYQINAEEMTSFEVEDWLASQNTLPSGLHDLNRTFQEACDRVKFAKHDPVEAEVKETVNRAYQIIELLKPQRRDHVSVG